jgi:RNA-directed DNA polymerase
VVLDVDETVTHHVHDFIATWLQELGLELKPSKTQVTHTLSAIRVPSDFTSWVLKSANITLARTAAPAMGVANRLGFKTIIKPSKAGVHRHKQALAAIIDQQCHGHSAPSAATAMPPMALPASSHIVNVRNMSPNWGCSSFS